MRASSTVLREAGGEIPLAYSPKQMNFYRQCTSSKIVDFADLRQIFVSLRGKRDIFDP